MEIRTLMYVCVHGRVEIVKMLIKSGCKLNLKNNDDKSAFDLANSGIKELFN